MKGPLHVRSRVRRPGGQETYPSYSGTFMQMQETYVKVATILFNRRQRNVIPCLLQETKALCEILILWGEGRKDCIYLFFPWSLSLISELQETEAPWALGTPSLGSVYLVVDFAVPGTSFPTRYCSITHMPTLFPSLITLGNTANK